MNQALRIKLREKNITKRQCEVVALVIKTYTNKEVATELGLAVGTVKHYLTSVFMKLKIQSREQLILWCVQQCHKVNQ